MILAGDVGGTKVALAPACSIFKVVHCTMRQRSGTRRRIIPASKQIVKEFLGAGSSSAGGRFLAARFGVPGPVRHGRAAPDQPAVGAG